MSDTYKPRQAYLYNTEKQELIGRYLFKIGGEMSDGTKCWYMVDKDGNETSDIWYSIHRIAGKMIALEEGR